MAESCDDSISSRLPLAVHITNLYAHEVRSNRLRRDTERNIEDPNDSERVSKQVKTEEEGISEEKTGLTSDDLAEDTANLSSYREDERYERKQTCFDSYRGMEIREQKKISYVDPDSDPELSESDSDDIMFPPWYQLLSDVRMIEEKLKHLPGVSYGETFCSIVEVFSVSIHWNEKENMGGMRYHLYGNLFFDDMDRYYQKALEISSNPPLIVSNGDNLPLHGLYRCLWADVICGFFVCLMGHELQSCRVKCSENESKVLVREKDGILHRDSGPMPEEGFEKPMQKTIVGSDKLPYLKIHYSVVLGAFVVELEVKVVAKSDQIKDLDQILIDGQLCVRWLEFEKHMDEFDRKTNNYKIVLIDTEQLHPGGLSLQPLGTIPIQRRILSVPFGFTLVFESDIRTSDGDTFSGHCNILIDHQMRFKGVFEGGQYDMQINLVNYNVT